jgi:hypothetical protein
VGELGEVSSEKFHSMGEADGAVDSEDDRSSSMSSSSSASVHQTAVLQASKVADIVRQRKLEELADTAQKAKEFLLSIRENTTKDNKLDLQKQQNLYQYAIRQLRSESALGFESNKLRRRIWPLLVLDVAERTNTISNDKLVSALRDNVYHLTPHQEVPGSSPNETKDGGEETSANSLEAHQKEEVTNAHAARFVELIGKDVARSLNNYDVCEGLSSRKRYTY